MNKVQFGLENVHYAVITEQDGIVSYGTPIKHPGAVSISLEPKGESSSFFADNYEYHSSFTNMGYEGTLELALITEEFRVNVLGEILDTYDKVLVENATAKPNKIALMFEFDGDKKATRHLFYHCTVSRPGMASATKTETSEPGTVELNFVATPHPTYKRTKVSTGSQTTETAYDAWYTKVWEPQGA